ncbi:MAG: SixA phosphatase family protein [Acidimicrobiales bacterium]
MPVLLVRHGHARQRKEWAGDDSLRPLSPHGDKQAEGLVSIARGFRAVTRALSSPYLRCVQTLGPLAAARGIRVEPVEALAEGQSSAAVRLVRSLAGHDIAVCTHGDVIAEILVSLADEDRVDLGPNPRQAKGSVWVLEGTAGSFSSACYLPPVVAEPV